MTQPNSPNRHHVPADVTDRWRSRWLVPLTPTALGAVILVASATHGHPISGLVWFAALAAVGAVSAMAERLQTARRSGRHAADEREAIINSRAMSIAGTVLVIALTACIAFTLARGLSTTPYTPLLAVGGISYVVALVGLRRNVP